jgi:tetratricopeptide (TPR) repeat protein
MSMVGVTRNAPCPCGSGKRYKECHGALTAPDAGLSIGRAPTWVRQAMRDALRAQRAGLGDDAAHLYRRVLEADPDNFDAAHMLGLVEYERGNYDAALELLKRAIGLRPDLDAPRQNLRRLEAMPQVETEVCREVLPRLARRLDVGFDVSVLLATVAKVNIVVADTLGEQERTVLRQLTALCATPPTIWAESAGGAIAGNSVMRRLGRDEHPHGGALVIVGAARSLTPWIAKARAERAVLIVTCDEPCAPIDRIEELNIAGYDRPGLLCATDALADRLRLHGAGLGRHAIGVRADA